MAASLQPQIVHRSGHQRMAFIVLKTHVYKEADLIVVGLTSGGRKERFLARAALKSQKRFGGGLLEPTRYIEALVKVREGRWSDLVEARMLRDFESLRSRYERMQAAFDLLDWVQRLLPDGGGDFVDTFHLLGRFLEVLAQSDQPAQVLRMSQVKLLALQGVLPPDPDWDPWLRTALADHASVPANLTQERWIDAELKRMYHDYAGIRRMEIDQKTP